ncbi:MAG: hypothetical protein GWP37_11585 [Gammaproteobacteria bacterium]|nr:hypothetical protein [Gammaproteobacteria bacterium]
MMNMLTNLLTSAFPGLGSRPPASPLDTAPSDFEATFADVFGSQRWSSPCTEPTKGAGPVETTESQDDGREGDTVETATDANTDDAGNEPESSEATPGQSASNEQSATGDELDDADLNTLSMIHAGQHTLEPSSQPTRMQAVTSHSNAGLQTDPAVLSMSMNDLRAGFAGLDTPDLWVSSEGGFLDTPTVPVPELRNTDRLPALVPSSPVALETAPTRTRTSMPIVDMTPKNVTQFVTDMSTHVRVIKNQGGGEARINLHPAELGRMSLSVVTEGSETKVSFFVENLAARQAVENALPRLREMLEQAGLSLTESDVSERHNDQQSDADAQSARAGIHHEPVTDAVHDDALEISLSVDPSRLLDTFA